MNMKLMMLFVVSTVVIVGALAVSGDDSDASADPSNGTRIGDLYYTFSGTNASLIGYSSSIDWSTFTTIPDTVEYNSITYNVTKIDSNAFQNCTNLALTSLPSGVTSIGSQAFYSCTNLALTSLPSGVTSIGSNAFYSCTNLALTSLPSGVTNIGEQAFADCPNLALTSLPEGLTYIKPSVFVRCTNLALTSLPSGVTNIDRQAFADCPNLALTSLPSGVTSIGNYAFYGCTNLALTSLPSGVTSIGSNAFKNCYDLNSIIVYGNTTFGDDVFAGSTLGSIVIVDTPTFSSTSLQYSGISEVLNLGSSEITTTTGGMNADEVRTGVQGFNSIVMLQGIGEQGLYEETVVRDKSVSAMLLGMIPVFIILGILLGIAAYMSPMIRNRI